MYAPTWKAVVAYYWRLLSPSSPLCNSHTKKCTSFFAATINVKSAVKCNTYRRNPIPEMDHFPVPKTMGCPAPSVDVIWNATKPVMAQDEHAHTPSCHTHTHFLACDPIIQSDMETIRHTQKSSLNNWGFVHLTYQYALNILEIPTSPIAYSMAHRRQSEIIWKKDASERRNEWAQQPVETWSPGWCHQVLFLLNKPACIIRIDKPPVYHHISDWWFQPYYIIHYHYNTMSLSVTMFLIEASRRIAFCSWSLHLRVCLNIVPP